MTSDNEWYNEWQRLTTSDNEWQWVVQQVTTSNNEKQWVATNDNKWQQVIKSGTTNKNGTSYFKEWMIAILSKIKIDTLLQGMDGWY